MYLKKELPFPAAYKSGVRLNLFINLILVYLLRRSYIITTCLIITANDNAVRPLLSLTLILVLLSNNYIIAICLFLIIYDNSI
jgi:hypothetical protein